MTTPAELKYTKSHEWIKQEADGTVTVGITHHAQELLGDLVFVELPAVGRKLKQGEECAVVESVSIISRNGPSTGMNSQPRTLSSPLESAMSWPIAAMNDEYR